jgi:hypothetical protein
MKKRQFIVCFSFLLSGCMASESNTESTATPTKTSQPTIKDTDGDGVIDSEDYAPRDPEVQEKSDVTQPTTRPPPQNERVKEADDPFIELNRDSTDDNDIRGILGTAKLQPGEYTYLPVTVNSQEDVQVEIRVENSRKADFILTFEDELDDFVKGEIVEAAIILSKDATTSYEASSTQAGVGLDPGDYVYILDNTKRRISDPEAEVIINFNIIAGEI